MDDQKLAEICKTSNLINSNDLAQAIALAAAKKISLYRTLLEKDLINDEALGRLMADYFNVPFIDLVKTNIDPKILNLIPEIVAKKQHIIAFAKDQSGLKLAMSNPANFEIREFVKKKSGEEIIVYFATELGIENAITLYQKDLKTSFDQIIAENLKEASQATNQVPPIAKLVDTLINYAYKNRASDIHIEPTDTETQIRLRIDGVLHDVVTAPKNLHNQIIARIKVLANLRTDEHLSAQDGKVRFPTEEEELDLRVSIVPIVEGEKAVLRLLSERSRQFTLEALGMGVEDLAKLKAAMAKPYGVILATGPTGCGKTTTIYAIVKILNTREKNIATIEDPVEYDIEGVNQIQVNPKTNLTFAEGLRSILRQDPDIMFVGEIRDQETAKIAINSAMTGHLVLSTVHTNDAATTLPRLLDMDVEPFLVASTVNLICAQRLIRLICTNCVVSKELSVAELVKEIDHKLIAKHFQNRKTIRVSAGQGCPVCHYSGFAGRIGIFELLIVTESIRKLITEKATSSEIAAKAVEEGMTLMIEDGLRKVERGLTTMEEVLRVTKS